MPGNRCSNCIAYSFECTYVEAARVSPSRLFRQTFVRRTQFTISETRTAKGVWMIASILFKCLLIHCLRYVEALENRIEKLQKLLSRVRGFVSCYYRPF